MNDQYYNNLILTGCRLLNDYCANVTYIVHVNGNMSARIETMEGERMLICVNNDWKYVTSSSTVKKGKLYSISTVFRNF